jgi:hypothetical protein
VAWQTAVRCGQGIGDVCRLFGNHRAALEEGSLQKIATQVVLEIDYRGAIVALLWVSAR